MTKELFDRGNNARQPAMHIGEQLPPSPRIARQTAWPAIDKMPASQARRATRSAAAQVIVIDLDGQLAAPGIPALEQTTIASKTDSSKGASETVAETDTTIEDINRTPSKPTARKAAPARPPQKLAAPTGPAQKASDDAHLQPRPQSMRDAHTEHVFANLQGGI